MEPEAVRVDKATGQASVTSGGRNTTDRGRKRKRKDHDTDTEPERAIVSTETPAKKVGVYGGIGL